MKKVRRLIGAMLACCMMLTMWAGAVETEPEDMGFYAPDPCGEGEIYISPEAIQRAEAVIAELMEAGIIDPVEEIMPLYGSETIGDYSTWDFAFALTGQDGVPVSAITLIKKFAADAKSVADSKYPNIATMNDSCRHFVWNYKGARSSGVGAYYMRVHGNNYEWAHLCNSELSSRYATRKTYWINQGETDPFTKAFTDTCAYFETVRNQKVSAIKSGGYSTFAKYVDTSSAMDFWNNQKGREYGDKGIAGNSNEDAYNIYVQTYNGGLLIDSEGYIAKGSSNYRTLYSNTSWWSH